MEIKEWSFEDKSGWGEGEWQREPDRVEWVDPATGYLCLILRGGVGGNLNGYVSVPKGHPAYGYHYDGLKYEVWEVHHKKVLDNMRAERSKPIDQRTFIERPPIETLEGEIISEIEVHGGLTYGGPNHYPTHEAWESAKSRYSRYLDESMQYPKGDAARWINEWEPVIHSYDEWAAKYRVRCLGVGDDDKWWFGFDCSHCMDLCPGMEATLKSLPSIFPRLPMPPECRDIYRNLAYVKAEVEKLAKQLEAMTCVSALPLLPPSSVG